MKWDNYPDFRESRVLILNEAEEHADKLGAEFEEDTVTAAELGGEVKKIVCENDTYLARAVIIATGSPPQKARSQRRGDSDRGRGFLLVQRVTGIPRGKQPRYWPEAMWQ